MNNATTPTAPTINTDFAGWKAVREDALGVIRTKGSYDKLLAANPAITLDTVQAYAAAFAASALGLAPSEFKAPRGSDAKRVKDRFGTSLRAALSRRDGDPATDESAADYLARVIKAAQSAIDHGHEAAEVRVALAGLLNL